MKTRLSFYFLLLVLLNSCALPTVREEAAPDLNRYLRLQAVIDRIGSSEFHPADGERIYPFTFVFRKAEEGEIIRQGEGFILLHETLWCLVQRWQDNKTGNPGLRMFIFDRSSRKFEAEVRQWPKGNLRERWNHWTCIRFSAPDDEGSDLYHCEYYYPEGTELVIRNAKEWYFYKAFMWNEDGLLEKMTRFWNSSVEYRYEGLKLKRIEFRQGETMATFTEFTYK